MTHNEETQRKLIDAERKIKLAVDLGDLAAAKAALAEFRSIKNGDPILPDGWPKCYTEDRVLIVPGLVVLDYNWRVGQVTDELPHESHGVYWFRLTTGTFDGTRMTTRHPKGNGKPLTEADLDSDA